MDIRRFRPEDAAEVTGCIAQLQTYERTIDERMLPGEAVEDWYLGYLLKTCAEQDGTLFVAEVGGRVVGYAAVQSRVPNEDVDESESHRGQGIGRALIEACEAYARGRDARWLRIGVLRRNDVARGSMSAAGSKTARCCWRSPCWRGDLGIGA